MKLVELLARELAEWPDSLDCVWQSKSDHELYFDGPQKNQWPKWLCDNRGWVWRVTRAAWEAERAKLAKPAIEPAVVENVQAFNEQAEMRDFIAKAVDGQIQCRDRIREIETTVEALEEERVSLVQRLEDEGFKLIDQVNAKIAEAKHAHEDMSDWRNWKVGDMVEITGETRGHEFEVGDIVTIECATGSDECRFKCIGRDDWWWVTEDECRFYSRP